MDSKRIEELLSKYWNCETSLEEEKMLREFLIGQDVPEQFREASLLFQYFDAQRQQSLAESPFDQQTMTRMVGSTKSRVMSWVHSTLRIAAGIAVLATAVWFVRSEIRNDTPQEIIDTYSDPELAFEETKKALLMISKSFGTAEEQAKKINLFNEAQEKIEGNDVNNN